MIETIETNLCNYYGSVVFVRRGRQYTMELENWDGTESIKISRQMWNTAKEFLNKKKVKKK